MSRLLPKKRSEKQTMIIQATFDFFGSGLPLREIPQVRDIAIYLMGRKKGITLSEEQKHDMECIKENLKYITYCQSLLSNPVLTP